jgi:hypothetical protein
MRPVLNEKCPFVAAVAGSQQLYLNVYPVYLSQVVGGMDSLLRCRAAASSRPRLSAVALRERPDTQPAAAKVKAQVMDDLDKALAAFKSAVYFC